MELLDWGLVLIVITSSIACFCSIKAYQASKKWVRYTEREVRRTEEALKRANHGGP